jgi:hypothetical protein
LVVLNNKTLFLHIFGLFYDLCIITQETCVNTMQSEGSFPARRGRADRWNRWLTVVDAEADIMIV